MTGDVLQTLFVGWAAEPVPLLLAIVGGLLYVAGARRLRRAGGIARSGADGSAPSAPPSRGEAWCLALGVAAILLALVSPLDALALQLQWAHMVQHLLLLLVAPPLVVLARPLIVAGAALPGLQSLLAVLRRVRRTPARRAWQGIMCAALFVGVLWMWHIPSLYNLTLRDQFVHDMEHTTFLAVGLLFWNVAMPRDSPWPSLGMAGRSVLVLAGLVGSWLLAVYIGYAPTVLFAYHGAGGLSATADQQIAAGVMWVPGSVPFVVVLVMLVARWFDNDARSAGELRPASQARS